MARAGWKEIAVLLICVSIPCIFSYRSRLASRGEVTMIDFAENYYGALSAMHRRDPYDPGNMLREFREHGGRFAPDPASQGDAVTRTVLTRTVNLPTTLFLTIPFSLLPWWLTSNLWMLLTAATLVAGAFLIWDLGAGTSPLLWAGLAGFLLAEADGLFQDGNVAGIAVGCCLIALWCFLKRRYAWLGIVLLAVSLVLKPHDSGFVWLYLLLAGRDLRKRALHTLAVTCVLAALAAVWIAPISPHWPRELHDNIAFESAHGNTNDPGFVGMGDHAAGVIIDLQSVLSGFKDDPGFYNPLSYLIGGLPILALALAALRKRESPQGTAFALAAISALSLLPVYHRINDSMLLLLAIPACALLWHEQSRARWLALGLTFAGIFLTASTPLAYFTLHFPAIFAFASRLPGRLLTIFVLRPIPFVLFAMGCFYLWLYFRYEPAGPGQNAEAADTMTNLRARLRQPSPALEPEMKQP